MERSLSMIVQVLQIPKSRRKKFDYTILFEVTKEISFFKRIKEERKNDDVHRECCRVMNLETAQKGSKVFEFGEIGDKFYIILEGKVGVFVPTKKIVNQEEQKKEPEREQKSELKIRGIEDEETPSEGEYLVKTPPPRRKAVVIPKSIASILEDFHNTLKEKEVPKKQTKADHEHKRLTKLFKQEIESEDKFFIDFEKHYVEESNSFIQEMKEVAEFGAGSSFGEFALLNDKPRSATIVAKTACHFAVLNKFEFRRILGSIAEKEITEKVEYLYCHPFFKGWSRTAITKLSYYFHSKFLRKNHHLFRQNENVGSVYFIKEGEFKVSLT